MAATFEQLYDRRTGAYAKDAESESFLRSLNETLEPHERAGYRDLEIEAPFLFVLGLPRSATTLTSQLLAYCLDVGYVDNVAARFWLAPVHGVLLSRELLGGERPPPPFESDYARTPGLNGIHEFGYFWRRWLRKESFADVVHAREREDEIDWEGLRLTLANVQRALGGKPVAAKNILASYHLPKVRETLGRVVYVYVERDPLDAAVSILDARRRYYEDPRTWWSYTPPEVEELLELDEWGQVAGQVHYLQRLYEHGLPEAGGDLVVRTTYEKIARRPRSVLEAVAERSRGAHGIDIPVAQEPPASFPFRTHEGREDDKARFRELLDDLAAR